MPGGEGGGGRKFCDRLVVGSRERERKISGKIEEYRSLNRCLL